MTPPLPAWVSKRDGRREPFDVDKISQSIFAATEAAGAANAFLARELTDGVLHFLAQDHGADIIDVQPLVDLIEKVVRELGHPALAQAFAQSRQLAGQAAASLPSNSGTYPFGIQDDPDHAAAQFNEAFSLHAVFGRDLAAAHRSELITLSGLDEPASLAAVALDAPEASAASISGLAWRQVRQASRRSSWLAVDSADLLLAQHGPRWLDDFVAALDLSECQAVLNLHLPSAPPWADPIAAGPLFALAGASGGGEHAEAVATILSALGHEASRFWSVHWHLQPADLAAERCPDPLAALLSRPALLPWITFTLDRPRRPVALGLGLDRGHPAVLLCVRLPLSKFLARPGIDGDGATMIAKLPSLVRMAVSAGVQKRNYLRHHRPELSRGFLLDRTRLVIEPVDLVDVIAAIAGTSPRRSKLALDAGRRILQTLHDAAVDAGKAANLDATIADFQGLWVDEAAERESLEDAWRANGALLDEIGGGLVRVRLEQLSGDAVWRHLRLAAKHAGVAQVHFAP